MMEIKKPTIIVEEKTPGKASFIVEPLVRGYGTTLGNALRRVLYTALPGAAIVGVIIEGVQHEFSTIKGVKEDVAEIILNLKELAIKWHTESEETATLKLKTKKAGIVFAKDIEIPSDIEIMNPDAPICTLSEGASINMTMTVGRGEGYVPANANKNPDAPIGYIPIDSLFSPVKFVKYDVSDTRVAQTIDYDKLVIEVTTNATATPKEVISLAAKILVDHLKLFIDLVDDIENIDILVSKEEEAEPMKIDMTIEQLELSVRPLNCLKRANINMVEELLDLTEEGLGKIKNLGKKSADEIIEKLKLQGLSLKSKE